MTEATSATAVPQARGSTRLMWILALSAADIGLVVEYTRTL